METYLLVVLQTILIFVRFFASYDRAPERLGLRLWEADDWPSNTRDKLLLAHPLRKFAVHWNLTVLHSILKLLLA